jgi:hypothetical protein
MEDKLEFVSILYLVDIPETFKAPWSKQEYLLILAHAYYYQTIKKNPEYIYKALDKLKTSATTPNAIKSQWATILYHALGNQFYKIYSATNPLLFTLRENSPLIPVIPIPDHIKKQIKKHIESIPVSYPIV